MLAYMVFLHLLQLIDLCHQSYQLLCNLSNIHSVIIAATHARRETLEIYVKNTLVLQSRCYNVLLL
jgi:hypothetical protein